MNRGALPDGARKRPPLSSIALAVFNLVPLGGVVFFRWDVFTVLLLFWMENVVVGLFNVLRMAKASGGADSLREKAFSIAFFIFHYGVFTLVHGVFVVSFFGLFGYWHRVGWGHYEAYFPPGAFLQKVLETVPRALPALVGLTVSHGVSYFLNYIGAGEFRRAAAEDLLLRPYGRVVTLHVTILLGGFVALKAGAGTPAVAMLVMLKIMMDLLAHWAERRKLAGTPLALTDSGAVSTADVRVSSRSQGRGFVASIEASILAPPDEVYKLAKDVERFPQFVPDLERVEILSREGNSTRTRWVRKADGGSQVTWVQNDRWLDEQREWEFEAEANGSVLYRGTWRFTPEGAGTLASLQLEFDIPLPVFGRLFAGVLRRGAEPILRQWLAALKAEAERGQAS